MMVSYIRVIYDGFLKEGKKLKKIEKKFLKNKKSSCLQRKEPKEIYIIINTIFQ